MGLGILAWTPSRPTLSPSFRQRWPWIGPHLQTLRDTVRPLGLGPDGGQPLALALPGDEQLLVLREPPSAGPARGLVVLVHGLGGSAGSGGVRRLARWLQTAGFEVWRLNLRGAGGGRPLAAGTYAAACNRDLLPILAAARRIGKGLPLLGAGLSLGGAVLLNAALAEPTALDALATVSSPLDLDACSRQIDAPGNRLYQRWLLRGLFRQTLADPFGLAEAERQQLTGSRRPRSLRDFDAAITAPRWGYSGVREYYQKASALQPLLANRLGLPLLLLQAQDDPWVPAAAAQALRAASLPDLELLLPPHGGHNGFHFSGDSTEASWADRQVATWLMRQVGAAGSE
ncbi:MAG: alpha/beta fold hydrolase [Cyanobacteriota bacterium]|nr:alpha/beta fold hydrolase [Cyanobacteriota bacterium]